MSGRGGVGLKENFDELINKLSIIGRQWENIRDIEQLP
jgi:hypothetical protein